MKYQFFAISALNPEPNTNLLNGFLASHRIVEVIRDFVSDGGKRIEHSQYHHSYACRPNKGVHKAIVQVQSNIRRFPVRVQMDVCQQWLSEYRQLLLFRAANMP